MVSKVLRWKNDNPDVSNQIWDEINELNRLVATKLDLLDSLGQHDEFDYTLDHLSSIPSSQVDNCSILFIN